MFAELARGAEGLRAPTVQLKPISEKLPRKTARLRKRLQQVEALRPTDQRAVLKLLDLPVEARRR